MFCNATPPLVPIPSTSLCPIINLLTLCILSLPTLRPYCSSEMSMLSRLRSSRVTSVYRPAAAESGHAVEADPGQLIGADPGQGIGVEDCMGSDVVGLLLVLVVGMVMVLLASDIYKKMIEMFRSEI